MKMLLLIGGGLLAAWYFLIRGKNPEAQAQQESGGIVPSSGGGFASGFGPTSVEGQENQDKKKRERRRNFSTDSKPTDPLKTGQDNPPTVTNVSQPQKVEPERQESPGLHKVPPPPISGASRGRTPVREQQAGPGGVSTVSRTQTAAPPSRTQVRTQVAPPKPAQSAPISPTKATWAIAKPTVPRTGATMPKPPVIPPRIVVSASRGATTFMNPNLQKLIRAPQQIVASARPVVRSTR